MGHRLFASTIQGKNSIKSYRPIASFSKYTTPVKFSFSKMCCPKNIDFRSLHLSSYATFWKDEEIALSFLLHKASYEYCKSNI